VDGLIYDEDIYRVIKSMGLRWLGHVVRMGNENANETTRIDDREQESGKIEEILRGKPMSHRGL
jgi:hypothetical protein